MRKPTLIALVILALSLYGTTFLVAEVLDGQLQAEAQLLDQEVDMYLAARDAEKQALDAYKQAALLLDDEFEARRSLDEINAKFDKLEQERQAFVAAAGNAMIGRQRLIARATRIRGILDQKEEAAPEIAAWQGPLDGVWRFSVKGQEDIGSFELRQEGGVVVGQYLLENGSKGSLRGTYAGDVLRIESIHSEKGLTYTLEGRIDPETKELRGTYMAVVLNQPTPASGEWYARKVSWGGK